MIIFSYTYLSQAINLILSKSKILYSLSFVMIQVSFLQCNHMRYHNSFLNIGFSAGWAVLRPYYEWNFSHVDEIPALKYRSLSNYFTSKPIKESFGLLVEAVVSHVKLELRNRLMCWWRLFTKFPFCIVLNWDHLWNFQNYNEFFSIFEISDNLVFRSE